MTCGSPDRIEETHMKSHLCLCGSPLGSAHTHDCPFPAYNRKASRIVARWQAERRGLRDELQRQASLAVDELERCGFKPEMRRDEQ